MNIALIGPPGSGKRTHAPYLAKTFQLSRVSSGDLFRQHVHDKTALGILASDYVQRGELVPDDLVDAMLEEWIRKHCDEPGLLFEGFPRTLEQCRFLDGLLAEVGSRLNAVFYLRIRAAQIDERLQRRMVCPRCQASYHLDYVPPAQAGACDVCGHELVRRDDDAADVIQARKKAFDRTTQPLIAYYQQQGKLVIVDAQHQIAEVRTSLNNAVSAFSQGDKPTATPAESKQLIAQDNPGEDSAERVTAGAIDVVLLGAPGSGKGTQADSLCEALDLIHVATGDLFRENLKQNTELGQLAKTYMDRGDLVPDEVTDAMVKERLGRADARDGFLLDGYPRNLNQAQALAELEASKGRRVTAALYIKVSDEEIVKRLSGRLICRACQTPYHREYNPPAKEGVCDQCGGELYQRDDDNPETVRSRLKTFHAKTAPVVDFYRDAGVLMEVNGEGDLDDVSTRCLDAVQKMVDARHASG